MTPSVRRLVSLVLLAISLVWLCAEAPGPFFREAWFVAVVLGLTAATRSVSSSTALSALSLGIGAAAPAMVAIGWTLAKAGLDVSEGGVGSWGVVPVAEELVKLATVVGLSWIYERRSRLTFNPSDWLLAGCAVGAGFAMVENAQLVAHDSGVLRDMARQYGPSWLVPGAWGAAGYVGHAAATGFAAAGIGLAIAYRRAGGPYSRFTWPALLLPLGWVTLEHVLANLHVDTGSNATFLVGNGRLTPWLFLAYAGIVISMDWMRAGLARSHSRVFRQRAAAVRALIAGSGLPRPASLLKRLAIAAAERRLLNAAAWVSCERLMARKAAH
jgi:RsiW-degrading membrane proteinase PrsW (M82 family)